MKVVTTNDNRVARLECCKCRNILEITPNDVYTGLLTETKYIKCLVCGKKQSVDDVTFYDKTDSRSKYLTYTTNW